MNLQEFQERIKDENVTEEQLWAVHPIYCLLDFEKDDFCKLVKAIGLEKWLQKAERWERLNKAEEELTAKEKYLSSKRKLEDLQNEAQQLEEYIKHYENSQSK